MAEQSLEARIKELKHDSARYDFAAGIVERIGEIEDISPFVVPAIDELVRKYRKNSVKRGKRVIVVEGDYSARINPINTLSRPIPSTEYKITLFYKRYLVKVLSGFKDFPINARIRLEKGNLRFSWELDGDEHTKSYIGDDFFYCEDLAPYRFNNSSGAAIKRLDRAGRLTIGGDYNIFGRAYAREDLVVVFNRGRVYAFDFFGRRVLPTIDSLEMIETRKTVKAFDVCDKMKYLNLDDWTEGIFKQVVQRWIDNPSDFERSAVNIITYGEFALRTDKRGFIQWFNHPRAGPARRQSAIHVGKDHQYKDVVLAVKGNYVSVYSGDEMLNAHRLPMPLTFGRLNRRYSADDIGLISMKTVKNIKGHPHGQIVGRDEYEFSIAYLKSVLGGRIDSFDSVGIAGFRENRNTYFIILAKKGADLLSSGIEHTCAKESDYGIKN